MNRKTWLLMLALFTLLCGGCNQPALVASVVQKASLEAARHSVPDVIKPDTAKVILSVLKDARPIAQQLRTLDDAMGLANAVRAELDKRVTDRAVREIAGQAAEFGILFAVQKLKEKPKVVEQAGNIAWIVTAGIDGAISGLEEKLP